MKKALIVLFLIFSLSIFCQNNSIKRFYEVSFCGKPQIVQLTEYEDGTVEGLLKTELIKEESSGKETKINREISFSDSITKKILTDLENAGIETLIKCEEEEECNSLGFLDGDFIAINTLINGKINSFTYSSILPESESNLEFREIGLRRKVQILATIIDKEINLKKQFSETFKNLKTGTYCYWSGITKVCSKHK
jgi:hypothetical protein